MEYKITGGNLPVVRCTLEKGESIYCEAGGMSWMDSCFEMDTKTGGAKTIFSKFLTSEKLLMNKYIARDKGEIAFASAFPGSIGAMEISNGEVDVALHFEKMKFLPLCQLVFSLKLFLLLELSLLYLKSNLYLLINYLLIQFYL